MKKTIVVGLAALAISTLSNPVIAQDYEYHPTISDSFSVILGAMRSSNSFKVEADGLDVNADPIRDEIDFNDVLGVEKRSTFFNGQIRWKFGKAKKWSLFGQYFSNDAKNNTTLEEDVEWEGIVFKEGTFVEAGVKLAVTRVFLGRSWIKNDQHDFGLGVGIHNLDMKAYLEGEIKVDDDTTGVQGGEVGGSQILPNIGGWYNFSPAKKWLLHARVDWISANIGDYDGGMWNTSIGVNYQAWRHVGFDLAWQYFNLNLNVDKDDWQGGADMTYSGPVLAVTFNW